MSRYTNDEDHRLKVNAITVCVVFLALLAIAIASTVS